MAPVWRERVRYCSLPLPLPLPLPLTLTLTPLPDTEFIDVRRFATASARCRPVPMAWSCRRISDEVRMAVDNAYAKGEMSYEEVARRFGISSSSVRRIVTA